jgi:hypothetical protein
MPMIAITTSNSIKVNPERRDRGQAGLKVRLFFMALDILWLKSAGRRLRQCAEQSPLACCKHGKKKFIQMHPGHR